MNSNKSKLKFALCLSFTAVLLVFAIALTSILSVFDSSLVFLFGKSVIGEGTRSAGEALATQIVEEGVVLVENKDNVLPLIAGVENRMAVLGWSSTQWVQGGSGSGRSTNNYTNDEKTRLLPNTTFLEALDAAGIEYDSAVTNYYSDFCGSRPYYNAGTGGGALNVHDYEYCRLIEPSVSISTYKALLDSAAQNYDTALVVITRISGESIDCPMAQYKNYTGDGNTATSGALQGAAVDTSRTYLDVSTEEEELLEYAKANFDRVIVLINNTNTMNLSFLKDYDVDACIIAGGTGNNSVNGLINVLYGEKVLETKEGEVALYEGDKVLVSPSGKTVDTYVYDFATNPSFLYSAWDGVSQYTGLTEKDGMYPFDGKTNNGNVNASNNNEKYPGVSYLDYIEGIYVGYKWYETADAEGFWNDVENKYGKGYEGVVQYPFGYGLSYTEFEWTVSPWTVSDGKVSVTVDVTNVGDYPGQDVVQLYYTPPYTNGGLEKAAVNLAAFAKTTLVLAPQKDDPNNCSQRLTLTFDIQDMASYDQNEGNGAYVLESGAYTLSLRSDAHTIASDKIVSGNATYNYNANKKEVYNTYTGSNGKEEIRNLFLDGSSDGVAIDGSDSNQQIDWLSRKDGFANFPAEKAAARAWQTKLNATNLYSSSDANAWDSKWSEENGTQDYDSVPAGNFKLANIEEVIRNKSSKLKYVEDRTEAFNEAIYIFGDPDNYDDDDLWNSLLNQMSKDEMLNLVLHGYIHEEQVESIGKPSTRSLDGPSQVGSFNASAYAQIGYPNTTVLAQTWNEELATSFGLAAAQQALGANVDGWYAPGANLHRSAFGGRNYEYYSEDPYLSGVMCANTVRGALNGGVYTYIKHLIGYDQESNRDGLYCWMTEQALRETYLKPFKMAVDKGASGLMSSYGRIGAVWAGGSEALLTDLLRNEWGFKGTVLTDYADHTQFMNGDQMIRAGGDLWMDGYTATAVDGYGGPGKFNMSTTSDAFNYQLRQAAKHIIYTWANAAYEAQQFVENGGDKLVIEQASIDVFKWWWIVCGVVDALCVGGAAVLLYMAFRKPKNATPDTEATTDTTASDGPNE